MDKLKIYLQGLDSGESISSEYIDSIERQIDFTFPKDYVLFMTQHNGAEGSIGESGYLALWTIDEIVELNFDYQVEQFALGLLLIGTDGGNVGYAYDTKNVLNPIVEVPLVGMSLKEANRCADTFNEFLKYLYEQE